MNLSNLKQVVPFKWKPNNKVGKAEKTMFQCVGYLDARQVREILDEVVGPENWACDFKEVKNNLFGGIGINVHGDKMCGEYPAKPEWIWRWDCGTESMADKEKGEASDAFKRASVAWGIGSFLYSLGIVKVPAKEWNGKFYPCDDKGQIFFDMNKLGDYINKKYPDIIKKFNDKLNNNTNNELKKELTQPIPQQTISQPEIPGRVQNPNYTKDKTATYSKRSFTPETIAAVNNLKRDGKNGGEVLTSYLPDYNKAKNKSYTKTADINTDEEIMELVNYIKSTIPKSL